ncbi:MAG: alpha-N-arabinofuranosidase [Spirochaetes bacterium]|nr:alpha-N-arabinofuranosidase [Spirochaetota bacterium]
MKQPALFPSAFLLFSFACWGAPRTIAIDTARTGTPISPYIYGQFIEHLGRGVYGGLWAEMLEDRKFFFIIRDRYAPWGTTSDPNWGSGSYDYLQGSPWKVIGPPNTVSMDTDNPFTGIHSPVEHLPKNGASVGISQEGLALVQGRAYTGRVVLASDPGVSVVVRMVGDSAEAAPLTEVRPDRQYKTFSFQFVSPSTSDNARIEIVGTGAGSFEIGALSLMPADALNGWRRDVVALLKELDSPIYRWPGGNFVSGYNWRDGIGGRDTRPPRQNPAWRGVESNDVGIHEFMDLMSMIGAEPYVSLNTGLGTVQDAAGEVEYCVGPTITPMGKLRADNGHPDPFPVHWWAVGNEMYGQWQLGNMPLDQYVRKHNSVVDAIRRIDPTAHVVAVGAVGPWDEGILAGSADHMDLISEHIYRKEQLDVDAHSRQLADDIERIARTHRNYRTTIPALAGRNLRIAMDEWNYWYGRYIYGELGVQYHLKDALGIARGLHAFFRNSDLYFMANYAQTVNVIGAIKTSRTDATFDTTGLVLSLYRNRFGSIPVLVSGTAGKLDISAALTEDGKALTVAVVNPQPLPDDISLDVRTAALSGQGTRWILTGPDPMSDNQPGKPPTVTITESALSIVPSLQVPAYSVTLFRFELK